MLRNMYESDLDTQAATTAKKPQGALGPIIDVKSFEK